MNKIFLSKKAIEVDREIYRMILKANLKKVPESDKMPFCDKAWFFCTWHIYYQKFLPTDYHIYQLGTSLTPYLKYKYWGEGGGAAKCEEQKEANENLMICRTEHICNGSLMIS